ncbi:LysE family translocator [Geomesophilobacter sediminis]|uniref:LysE family translocator n=1 Tax=Geomesophilobacter sediminis TaxID=2798584 RepID=A0A8J7S8I0_9BACT|nr:LysE family translocator [Geomesophilobacter sediminis]MBJ6727676.1 LysE family translocator [Geomesophilobacter sediminis]
MLTLSQLTLFSLASIVLIFTPGPDIIYVVTRGMAQGRRAALAATAGFALGNFVHTFFAVIGLSALIVSSATAFAIVRYAGALYLAWLGVRMIRSRSGLLPEGTAAGEMQCRSIFRQSIVANVMNPKVALFFLAFFPQFLDRARGGVPLQMLALGTTFVILTFFCFGVVALGAGSIGSWLHQRSSLGDRITRAAGCVLIGLGLRLAWPQR